MCVLGACAQRIGCLCCVGELACMAEALSGPVTKRSRVSKGTYRLHAAILLSIHVRGTCMHTIYS